MQVINIPLLSPHFHSVLNSAMMYELMVVHYWILCHALGSVYTGMLPLFGRLVYIPYTLLLKLGESQSLLAMRRTLFSSDQQASNICTMGQLETCLVCMGLHYSSKLMSFIKCAAKAEACTPWAMLSDRHKKGLMKK